MLLVGARSEVLALQGDLGPALLDSLADSSDQVVLQALDVQASLSREDPHFRMLIVRALTRVAPSCSPDVVGRCLLQDRLLRQFCSHPALLESRGSLVIRRLCVLLGAERVFREMAVILADSKDLHFAGVLALLRPRASCRPTLTGARDWDRNHGAGTESYPFDCDGGAWLLWASLEPMFRQSAADVCPTDRRLARMSEAFDRGAQRLRAVRGALPVLVSQRRCNSEPMPPGAGAAFRLRMSAYVHAAHACCALAAGVCAGEPCGVLIW